MVLTDCLTIDEEAIKQMNKVFKKWKKFKRSRRLIVEGGEAFKGSDGSPMTDAVEREYVQPTLDEFLRSYLTPANVNDYRPLGSTGKKTLSGDLDIVIKVPDNMGKNVFKRELLGSLQTALGAENAKFLGQNIAVRFPVVGKEGAFVQIDIMMDSNIEDTAWLLSGTGDNQVKGVFRNLMLSYVAYIRAQTGDPKRKMSLSYPGGLIKKVFSGTEDEDPRDRKNRRKWIRDPDDPMPITNPQKILDNLGINAVAAETNSFDELVRVLAKDPAIAQHLEGWPEYIAHARVSEEAKQYAIDTLNGMLREI
jgi:hypothetical protein